MASKPRQRSRFGSVRQLPPGRWQARYKGPDGRTHTAGMTFPTKSDAYAYLATVEADLIRGQWKAPLRSDATVRSYGQAWIRQNPRLKASTRSTYEHEFRLHIEPRLGHLRLDQLTSAQIREWRAEVGEAIQASWDGRGTQSGTRPRTGQATQARAYRLLRAILTTAVEDGILQTNPCRIKGGGEYDVAERPTLSVSEIEALAEAIDAQYRTFVYFAAYTGLRLGEVAGLRRKHVDLQEGAIRVMQAEGRHTSSDHPATPKSKAGNRVVLLPPFLAQMLREHLMKQATIDSEAHVFVTRTGRNVYFGAPRAVRKAMNAIGRPDAATHDLRHTASVLKAMSGATAADLKRDLGHSTMDAAQRYMHANLENQRAVAASLDERRVQATVSYESSGGT